MMWGAGGTIHQWVIGGFSGKELKRILGYRCFVRKRRGPQAFLLSITIVVGFLNLPANSQAESQRSSSVTTTTVRVNKNVKKNQKKLKNHESAKNSEKNWCAIRKHGTKPRLVSVILRGIRLCDSLQVLDTQNIFLQKLYRFQPKSSKGFVYLQPLGSALR